MPISATTTTSRGLAALLASLLLCLGFCCLALLPGPAQAKQPDPAEMSPQELRREERREERRRELWRSPSLRQRVDELNQRYRLDLDPSAPTEGAYGLGVEPEADEPAYGVIQPISPEERQKEREELGPIKPYEPLGQVTKPAAPKKAKKKGPDLATARMSREKAFQVSYSSSPAPNSQGAPTTWTVKLLDPLGVPITGASITPVAEMPKNGRQVAGGMVAVSEVGGGVYRIRGMAFDRKGWWRVRLIIQARGFGDEVDFNLVLP